MAPRRADSVVRARSLGVYLVGRRVRIAKLRAQGLELALHRREFAPCVRQLRPEPPVRFLGAPMRSLAAACTRAASAFPVDLSHVRRAPSSPRSSSSTRPMIASRASKIWPDAATAPGSASRSRGCLVGRGRRCRLDQRPEHDDRPGGHSPSSSCASPATAAEIQSTTLARLSSSRASASPRGAAIASARGSR